MAYALKVLRVYSIDVSNGSKKDLGFFLKEDDIDPKLRNNPNLKIEPIGIIVLEDDSDYFPGMRFATGIE